MEMTSGANNYTRVPDDLAGDPAAAAEPCPPAPREKETRRGRVLAVAGIMALPLLAFFILGRESASTVWDFASAKLMNNGLFFNNSSPPPHATTTAAAAAGADELLGGLLAPGMDRHSCQSRYEISRYLKHFPYAPSPHLLSKLRAYEARHRRCAPGTPLYAKSVDHLRRSVHGASAAGADDLECSYYFHLLDGDDR